MLPAAYYLLNLIMPASWLAIANGIYWCWLPHRRIENKPQSNSLRPGWTRTSRQISQKWDDAPSIEHKRDKARASTALRTPHRKVLLFGRGREFNEVPNTVVNADGKMFPFRVRSIQTISIFPYFPSIVSSRNDFYTDECCRTKCVRFECINVTSAE